MDVTTGQLALLVATIVVFVAGGAASLSRLWVEREALRHVARACLYGGLALGLAVLVWHSSARRGSWLPLEDNFDALVSLGVLLAAFVAYAQAARPLRGLDWFVMPIAVLLLVAAAVFGRTQPHEYVASTWSLVHRATSYVGAAAFAVSAAVGVMYLIVQRNLRHKPPLPGPRLGSLERLEHWVIRSVTLGFALLTIGLITGVVRIAQSGGQTLLGPGWAHSPKVWLSAAVWVVYAVVLHSPINPSFRGRRAAVLSVVGFVLMVGTIVAVQFMPTATEERREEPQVTRAAAVAPRSHAPRRHPERYAARDLGVADSRAGRRAAARTGLRDAEILRGYAQDDRSAVRPPLLSGRHRNPSSPGGGA